MLSVQTRSMKSTAPFKASTSSYTAFIKGDMLCINRLLHRQGLRAAIIRVSDSSRQVV